MGTRRRGYYTGPGAAEIGKADASQHLQLIGAALTAIGNLHRQTFDDAASPEVRAARLPSLSPAPAEADRTESEKIAWWRLGARLAARRAQTAVQQRTGVLLEEATSQQLAEQAEREQRWLALVNNDATAVRCTLAASFGRHRAPVAAVEVDGDEVALVVLAPGPEVLPDRYAVTTAAGELELREVTEALAAGWYRQLVAAHAVVAARHALAICPGLQSAKVLVVREGAGARPCPVLATTLGRLPLAGVRWETVTAPDVIEQVGTHTRVSGRAHTAVPEPIRLEDRPDLARLAQRVDLGRLAGGL